jgi:ATP-dependent protease HslVU (ClpYQ) ATPase subunit
MLNTELITVLESLIADAEYDKDEYREDYGNITDGYVMSQVGRIEAYKTVIKLVKEA